MGKQFNVAIIIYSLYGHTYKLAEHIKIGLDKVPGSKCTIFQVPELLTPEILEKVKAPSKSPIPIMKVEDLPNYDAFLFGLPTRYGMAPSQMKAFWDGTGGLWMQKALIGKMAGVFVSTASLHGGQETTALTFVSQLTHQGIIFVPFGYVHPKMLSNEEVHGGSPYGCGTITNSDGSRMASKLELEMAECQKVIVQMADEIIENPQLLNRNDSTLVFFGCNKDKICFGSTKAVISTPLSIKFWTNPKFIKVLTNASHAAAIDVRGDLYQWGNGFFGANDAADAHYEITLAGRNITQLDINSKLVACINSSGAAFILDSNKRLQKENLYENPPLKPGIFARLFRRNDSSPQFLPYRIPFVREDLRFGEKFVKVSIGEHHALFLTNKGRVYTGSLTDCGNIVGQLGTGPTADTIQLKPIQPISTTLKASVRYDYQNDYLSDRTRNAKVLDKVILSKLNVDSFVKDIACGSHHSVILDNSGNVLSFGYNDQLQCGVGPFHPDKHFLSVPTKMTILLENKQRITAVFARYKNSVVRVENGNNQNSFYACGVGLVGQLGNGIFSHVNGTPTLVKYLEPKEHYNEKTKTREKVSFDSISIGNGHLAAILKTSLISKSSPNTLYLWGKNSQGQLGFPSKTAVSIPRSAFLLNAKEYQNVTCGDEFTIVY